MSTTQADASSAVATKAEAKASKSIALDPQTRLWALVAAGACLLPLVLQLPATMAVVIAVLGFAVATISSRRRLPAWLRVLLAAALVGYVMAS